MRSGDENERVLGYVGYMVGGDGYQIAWNKFWEHRRNQAGWMRVQVREEAGHSMPLKISKQE